MKVVGILGITVILVFIFLIQGPGLKRSGKRVKMAFFSIMMVNWILAVLLVMFPEMSGPGQMVDFIYQSFKPFW
ncbi:hypothetical protein [Bacillus sp. OK048]|uniref:hypothetical protein n=1 Tax=Bacillus sp. OK048 TaxID=1882761 RepID=UPI0008907840|nr:hypothetical protein [Bacillus sp. OK048]SDN64322.1 hypothetical protein SAMN05443253_11592 [Bacillus sp. OK048]